MITKRWKTNSTGDESFLRGVLRDFAYFCANDKDRLVTFWNQYWKQYDPDKEDACFE